MATPAISGNPALQRVLWDQYRANRWRTPFVTDVRMSKEEAHSRAWAVMMAAKRNAEYQARLRR